jgi:two-component system probable response regulator PhcQ
MSTETQFDGRKFAILYVDDEETSLSLFKRAFQDDFRIYTASNAKDGLKLLEAHADEIGILMTDQRMPGEKGVWLLERARQSRPQILRILVTAYSDMDLAIDAVNNGAIYKYVTKPWDPLLLEQLLKRGLEYFIMQSEREELLKERSALMRERMIANRLGSLGVVAAGLSQNIRNSLVTVKTFLALIEEKSGSSNLNDPELLQIVRTDVEKILGQLDDLRIVSPDASGKTFKDEINLKLTIQEVLESSADVFLARRISIGNQVPDNLPPVRGNRTMLRRLFELLSMDELATLPTTSRLEFTAQTKEAKGKAGIAITVADNGPALPQDTLEFVLNPMATKVSPSEFGIHLFICFFIVHHHGGSIEASCRTEGGNEFVIWLPIQPEQN